MLTKKEKILILLIASIFLFVSICMIPLMYYFHTMQPWGTPTDPFITYILTPSVSLLCFLYSMMLYSTFFSTSMQDFVKNMISYPEDRRGKRSDSKCEEEE